MTAVITILKAELRTYLAVGIDHIDSVPGTESI